MLTLHNVEQRSPQWLKLREGRQTGSTGHILLKNGFEAAQNASSGHVHNYHTQRGTILESEALELYEKITGITPLTVGFVTNDELPNAGYSPDGVAGETLLEIKCFAASKHLKVAAGAIPVEVQAQIQFGMMICELLQAQLILYNPEVEVKYAFVILPIKRNEKATEHFKRLLYA